MRTQPISTTLMALSLAAFGAVAATPEHAGQPGGNGMSHEPMMMAHEPHHVLAMAYHQNLATFAKALQEQTKHDGTVNVDFARAAVAEMRRSFDQMSQHHEEHMKTMSTEMQAKMGEMMEKMKTHHAEMNTQLAALEQEVQLPSPDAKKVSTLADGLCTHLEAMSKMHQGGKMKM